MLSRGAATAGYSGLSCVRWVQADASTIPFRDGVFEAVVCAYALYELKGPARTAMLREAERVLVPEWSFLAMEHEVPTRPLPRFLFALRLAIIGAEGVRAFLGGEVRELGRVFARADKEVLPPGKSKILTGTKGGSR
jgi:ubiquinone/menaquinone biosynthesis C-methylase UbiE